MLGHARIVEILAGDESVRILFGLLRLLLRRRFARLAARRLSGRGMRCRLWRFGRRLRLLGRVRGGLWRLGLRMRRRRCSGGMRRLDGLGRLRLRRFRRVRRRRRGGRMNRLDRLGRLRLRRFRRVWYRRCGGRMSRLDPASAASGLGPSGGCGIGVAVAGWPNSTGFAASGFGPSAGCSTGVPGLAGSGCCAWGLGCSTGCGLGAPGFAGSPACGSATAGFAATDGCASGLAASGV